MGITHRATAVGGALFLAILTAVTPGRTAAQGFSVNEHGTCVMGRAGTGVALPCLDGSAMVYNPAGLVQGGTGWTVTAGVTVIAAGGDFTYDRDGRVVELQNGPIPVPHAYARYGWSDRLAFGLGLFVPYGLGTEWPRMIDGEPFSGAFSGNDNNIQSPYVQPTVAYRVTDRISVGAGLTVVHGSLELNQLVDLSEIPTSSASDAPTFGELGIPRGTAFADSKLEGDSDFEFGFHAGTQVQVTDALSAGARYLSAVELEYDGTAEFSQVSTGIVLPPGNPFGVPGGTSLDDVLATEADGRGLAFYNPNPILDSLRAEGEIPFFPNTQGVAAQEQPFGPWFSKDGVHPSTAAHLLLAARMAAAIDTEYGTALAQ